jgi:hypothetical protein
MKKFRVNLYLHGCYSVDVEANNESEALGLNDKEFISAIDLMEEDYDVYEL